MSYYVKDVIVLTDKKQDINRLIFLTGILNSKLMAFYYETSFPTLHVQRDELASLPICKIESTNPTFMKYFEQIVSLVKQILALHKRTKTSITAHENTLLQRQIRVVDQQIDQLVYQLYALTPEEIALVEGQTG